MKFKGLFMSLLVFVIFLGFLPIKKANASVSSDSVSEIVNRIDTSKNYYIVPADLPTRGLDSHPALNFYPFLVVSSRGNTVEKPGAAMKLHFSEENKKYLIGVPYTMPPNLERGYLWISNNLFFGPDEKYAIYWTITPVEGGYTLQVEGGYLNYEDYESPYGPLTIACLGKEKVVWKLVPAS
ncbi:hypothetical protein [Bacillus pseudomycoides]|uniref:hypothetical protein n=1 Tax=Bacillus pseudomycoides TaxID=64104 RepID=UPI003D65F1DE